MLCVGVSNVIVNTCIHTCAYNNVMLILELNNTYAWQTWLDNHPVPGQRGLELFPTSYHPEKQNKDHIT